MSGWLSAATRLVTHSWLFCTPRACLPQRAAAAPIRRAADLAPGEIVPGWGNHAREPACPPLCTCNEWLALLELSPREVQRHDSMRPLQLASTTLAPAEMRLRMWLRRVRVSDPLHFQMCHTSAGAANVCEVPGCDTGEHSSCLRMGTARLCEKHLRERCVHDAPCSSAGECAGCLTPLAAVDTDLRSQALY